MCGGSGGSGSGGRSGGGGSTNGDAGQPGEVYRAAQPKVKRVLVVNGKPAPGTKAYENMKSRQRVDAYRKKLKLDTASDRMGLFGHIRKI